MIGLLSTGKSQKKISVKYLLLTFFVCISMVAWLGISDLRAVEDDPEDNTDEIEVGFQNNAQEQHADNVAKQAALQDPAVIDLIELGLIDEAKAVYLGKVETFTQEISLLRASGMGWGDIAHKYEVHPSVLGSGHPPISFEESLPSSKHSGMKSKSKMVQKDSDPAVSSRHYNNQGKGLALGHSKDHSSNRGGGHGGGKGGGNRGGNGGGKGGGKK